MRLPFDQTNLRSPSQNRLSPVSSPRVQPLDLQTSANYAKLESLKQLGKGIFSIGDALFQNYANEKEQEKKLQYEALGIDVQKQSLLLEEDLRSNPSSSQQDDENRINEFWYGKRAENESRFNELQKKYDLPEKELKVLFEKAQVGNLSIAMASRTRMDFETGLFQSGSGFDRDLEENRQNFRIQDAPQDRSEFITQMDTYFETLINTHSEGLNSAQEQTFRKSALDIVAGEKRRRLSEFEKRSVDSARANYNRELSNILSLNLSRDDAVKRVAQLVIDYGPNGKEAFDEETGVKQLGTAEEIYDNEFANRLIDTNPAEFLRLYESQKIGEESFLPSLNADKRELLRQRAESELKSLIQKGRSEAVTAVQSTINEMLNPQTNLVRLKADFDSQIVSVPEEDQPKYIVAMDYYESLRQLMPNPLKTNKPYLEQLLLQKNPDYYQSETDGRDPAIELKRAGFMKFRNYINGIMELRENNGGLFWKQSHPNADPLEQSSISGNIQEQLRFLGADPRKLNQLIRVGKIKLMENNDMNNMVLSLQGLPSGTEYKQAYSEIISKSGAFAPYVLEKLGRDKREGGLGIEPSDYFYHVIRDPAILENLRSSVLNREQNNKQFREVMGIQQVDFNTQVQKHSSISNFRASYPMSNTSVSAFVSSSIEMVKGYAMELKKRDPDLGISEAIDRATTHLIDTNYAFVEPKYAGGTGRMVRIPRAEMGEITDDGKFQDALSVFITEVQENIEDPLIRETFSDREWAWFNDSMDQGFDLYTRVQGGLDRWVKVEIGDNDKQPLIPYSKLRVMAEDPKVAEKAPGFISDVPVVGPVVETLDDMGAGGVGLQEGAKRAGETSKGTGVQSFSTERAAEQLEQVGESIGTGVNTLKETLPGVVEEVADFFVESEEERAERIAERNARFKRVAEKEAKRSGKKTETPKTEPVETSMEEISQIENEIAELGDFPNLEVVKKLLGNAKFLSTSTKVASAEKNLQGILIRVRSLIAQEKTNRENMNDVLNSLKSK
tara:strand:- start:1692 stop:4730 length:3039 start_codon:yes stop_codon:yes gene_type:complete